jgi:hypothetical protein
MDQKPNTRSPGKLATFDVAWLEFLGGLRYHTIGFKPVPVLVPLSRAVSMQKVNGHSARRRPHKKSRNGCRECKKRHIKVSEFVDLIPVRCIAEERDIVWRRASQL